LQERLWGRGSYLAAGLALFLFVYNMGTAFRSTTWPTDGWQANNSNGTGAAEVTFANQFLREPTPILVGDRLVAMDGRPIGEILDDQHAFFRLTPPLWPDGTVLRYDVLRDGRPLTLDVPIRRVSFWSYFGQLRIGATNQLVQLAGSLFFFIVAVVVFLLRPGNRAAQALLPIGVAFLFNSVPGNYSPPAWFYPDPPFSIPFDTWTLAIIPSLMLLVLVFPRPKGVIRRFPLVVVLLLYLVWPIAFNTAYLLNLYDPAGYRRAAFSIYPVQIVLLMLVTVVGLAHSFMTVRDPVGRNAKDAGTSGTPLPGR
jgi:hypothetical protein